MSTSAMLQPKPSARSAETYRRGPRDTVIHALARAVEQHGDRDFANIGGERITYREIDARTNAMARMFAQLGVKKQDRVVTLFDNNMDVLICWFAINKLGAIWVPINTAYRGEFLRHQICDSAAELVLCDRHYLDRFVEIAGEIPDVRRILCRDTGPLPTADIPIEPLDAYRGDDGSPLPIMVEPHDLASLMYTSGTTGPSKGCMISHNYLCMQGRQQRRAIPQTHEDVAWTPLPMFHAAALTIVLGALVEGMRFAVWPRFSVSSFWDDIEASGATNALLMASIFPLVAHAPDTPAMKRCYGRLKMIYGQPITPEVREIWQTRFGVPLVSSWSYGQTEGVRLTMVDADETPPATCAGRVTDEFEMMIVDGDDQPLPDGEVGEIVYRPREPNVMFEGYWRRPEDTRKAWRNLWMHSGDLGYLKGGYLFFADRAKDYLRARGENVSSFELERVYAGHPAIAECAIHATGAQDAEDEIKATIVLREGAELSEHELCLWSIQKLPHFAVPRFYEFRRELIKNPTGRVLKYRLRDEGVTAATWDREAAGIVVRRQR
ncbi:AMP-binding protein [Sphingomonas profundi]|uniref:AMP-binding protein n=1 Tax=Alterirhizorhabdus profundi TaxID=2681549 RepID=UPI0018D18C7D|nr:AMP-binding protein [Sphingomonas profundi]